MVVNESNIYIKFQKIIKNQSIKCTRDVRFGILIKTNFGPRGENPPMTNDDAISNYVILYRLYLIKKSIYKKPIVR